MKARTRALVALLVALSLAFAQASSARPLLSRSSPLVQSQDEGLEPVSQFGGTSQAVRVQGTHAYVGLGRRMVVFDLADPTAPQEIARTDSLPDVVRCLDVTSYYAYVVAGRLHVVNIMDPAHPTILGTLPIDAVDIHVVGNYAYLASEQNGLRIVDIRTPSSPVEAAFFVTPDDAVGVHVDGGYAYVAMGASGVSVVDVSDPVHPAAAHASPASSGDASAWGPANDVFVSEGYACTSSEWRWQPWDIPVEGLVVTDVSAPTSPTRVGSYMIPSADLYYGWASKVFVSGAHAYVATHESYRGTPRGELLYVTDISEPAFDQELSGPVFHTWAGIREISLADGSMYLALGGGGWRILDASTFEDLSSSVPPGSPYSVDGCESYTYVLDSGSMRRADMRVPVKPVVQGLYDVSNQVDPEAFCVSDGYGFIGYPWHTYAVDSYVVELIDLTNPMSLTRASEIWWEGWEVFPTTTRGMHASGGALCLTGRDGAGAGLWVADVSDPTSPDKGGVHRFFASERVNSFAEDVYVVGTTAYVLAQVDAASDTCFFQVDVSDPESPAPIVGWTLPGTGQHLVVVDDRVFVTGIFDPQSESQPILWAIDVSEPLVPAIIGSCQLPAQATALSTAQGYAFASMGDGGVATIDISDPRDPGLVDVYDTMGDALDVLACGSYVYVADGDNGLLVLRHVAPTLLYLPLAFRQ